MKHLLKALSSVKFALVLLVLAVILSIFGTLGPEYEFVYGSVPYVALVVLLCLSIFLCVCSRPFNARFIGFFLVHSSIVLVAAGGLLTHFMAEHGTIVLREGEVSKVYYTSPAIFLEAAGGSERAVLPFTVPPGARGAGGKPVVIIPDEITFLGKRVQAAIVGIWPHADVNEKGEITKRDRDGRPAFTLSLTGLGRRPSFRLLEGKAFGKEFGAGGGKKFFIYIDKKPEALGFAVGLEKFEIDRYPGTDRESGYRSTVLVDDPARGARKRRAVIELNAPLEHAGYTIYQSSHAGPQVSVLGVSKTPGRWIVFLGFGLMVAGLLVVFYINPLLAGKKNGADNAPAG